MVIVDRTPVSLDRPIATRGNIVFSPLRPIFEHEGGTLEWSQATATVTARSPYKSLKLTIGHRTAAVNNEKVKLRRAPYLSHGRTMVPMALISKILDADIQFDPATGHLQITSKK
jgi:N-acetylmuramoyl-L-alanine amidase